MIAEKIVPSRPALVHPEAETGRLVSSIRLSSAFVRRRAALVRLRCAMAPTVYLARHGERLDFVNPSWKETAQNPHDPPLTATGEEQARELGQRLASCRISHIFASPFSRTSCTAARAAAALSPALPIKIEPGACEWLNMHWYGGPKSSGPSWRSLDDLAAEFEHVDCEYVPVYDMDINRTCYPENRVALDKRAKNTVDALIKRFGGEGNILLVGHGSTVEAFYTALVSEPIPTRVSCKYRVFQALFSHPVFESEKILSAFPCQLVNLTNVRNLGRAANRVPNDSIPSLAALNPTVMNVSWSPFVLPLSLRTLMFAFACSNFVLVAPFPRLFVNCVRASAGWNLQSRHNR